MVCPTPMPSSALSAKKTAKIVTHPEKRKKGIDIKEIVLLRMAGLTHQAIADKLGLSHQTVTDRLQKYTKIIDNPELTKTYERSNEFKQHLFNSTILRHTLNSLDEKKIVKTSPKDSAVIVGIMTEKKRLECGMSTSNLDLHAVVTHLRTLEAELASLSSDVPQDVVDVPSHEIMSTPVNDENNNNLNDIYQQT